MSSEEPCCRKHWGEDNGLNPIIWENCLINPIGCPMIRCSECGYKRCPKATDCSLECTKSNDLGQKGSIYGGLGS